MYRKPICAAIDRSWNLIIPLPFNYQIVRWRRKPRWLPVAKSKQFRVPDRTVTPIEEKIELLRLHNNYNTQVKAVRKYLYEEVQKEIAGQNVTHMSPEEEMEDLVQCAKINEVWNNDIAKIRDKRIAQRAKQRLEYVSEQIELQNNLKSKQLDEAEMTIRLLKEQSKKFITAANIDSAIEEALTDLTDYNFSIDSNGNIYKGRKTVAAE